MPDTGMRVSMPAGLRTKQAQKHTPLNLELTVIRVGGADKEMISFYVDIWLIFVSIWNYRATRNWTFLVFETRNERGWFRPTLLHRNLGRRAPLHNLEFPRWPQRWLRDWNRHNKPRSEDVNPCHRERRSPSPREIHLPGSELGRP